MPEVADTTRRSYYLRLCLLWAYTVVWIAAALSFGLLDIPVWWRVMGWLGLAVISPDLMTLTTSYDQYRQGGRSGAWLAVRRK